MNVISTASADERQLRQDLAACFRLAAHFGWDDLIFTHMSVRLPGPEHHFLTNPLDLTFEEIRASDLIKIDVEGRFLENTPYTVSPPGFVIHSAIHMGRDDARCVIHLHSKDGVAVSCLEEGLLPLNQSAMLIAHDIAFHEFEGPALDEDERVRLTRDLGSKNLMFLRNHGTLAVGENLAETFHRLYYLEWACSVQVKALATGRPLHMAPRSSIEKTAGILQTEPAKHATNTLLWPALKRMLERKDPSYLT